MRAARFSGILTVGVIAFGLWYFNSGPSGESESQPIAPVAEQVPGQQASAAVEIVPNGFSPSGSRILALRREGMPSEAFEGAAWQPVVDIDEADQDVDLEALRGVFNDFDELMNGLPQEAPREELTQFAMNGSTLGAPIRLISDSSAPGGSPAGSTSTTHKGISFEPEVMPTLAEGGAPDSEPISSLILLNVVENIGSPTDTSSSTAERAPLTTKSVPEPATLLLLATGIALGRCARRRPAPVTTSMP